MINHIFHKSTYIFAALAIVFIVSYAFAGRGASSAATNDKVIQLAKLESSALLNQPDKVTPRQVLPAELLAELDQRIHAYPQDYEASLLKVLAYIEAGDLTTANIILDDLLRKRPEFNLAQLVKGDLLAMRVSTVSGLGKNALLDSFTKNGKQVELQKLRDEVRIRLKNYREKYTRNKIPKSLLLMSKSVQNAILIDKSKNRLYLFQRQNDLLPPKLIKDFYVSTGKLRGNKRVKGDLKTPQGVYFITKWIPDASLPDKYGIGAFPVNYPNELDNRLGKTGYGIWLHGTTSDSYSRPPLDSEGCVVLPNIDLQAIKHLIKPGTTPMIIAEKIEWVDYSEWSNLRNEVLGSIEAWRNDWQSLDVAKYLSHYADNFWSGRHNLKSWRARKIQLSRSKKYQKVKLEDISLFAYPDDAANQDIVVARFHQSYQSNNYKSEMRKRIYLSKANSKDWKIMFEGK